MSEALDGVSSRRDERCSRKADSDAIARFWGGRLVEVVVVKIAIRNTTRTGPRKDTCPHLASPYRSETRLRRAKCNVHRPAYSRLCPGIPQLSFLPLFFCLPIPAARTPTLLPNLSQTFGSWPIGSFELRQTAVDATARPDRDNRTALRPPLLHWTPTEGT